MIELSCALQRGGFRLDVTATLPRDATGIFGPSGAGKSSLLHALAGLLPVERLRLLLDGEVLVDCGPDGSPPAHRRRIGLVFQEHRLFPHRSVADNLRYGVPRDGRPAPAWDEVVQLLDIGELLPRSPDECSGGQRQRIALGRALLAGPRLLLLDEPLASLDRRLKLQIRPYLRRIREHWKMPMLMVSHDLDDLLAVSDELLLLHDGAVVGQGDVAALAGNAAHLELLADAGLVSVLPGTVQSCEEGLIRVVLDGPAGVTLAAAGDALPPGRRVDVRIAPQDLVLALPPLRDTLSATNRLPGTIRSITATRRRCLVTIDIGATAPLLAELAERTLSAMALREGQPVVALAKAQSLQLRWS